MHGVLTGDHVITWAATEELREGDVVFLGGNLVRVLLEKERTMLGYDAWNVRRLEGTQSVGTYEFQRGGGCLIARSTTSLSSEDSIILLRKRLTGDQVTSPRVAACRESDTGIFANGY